MTSNLCKHPSYIADRGMWVDCGHCRACRLKKRGEWVTRITHELHTTGFQALFITLTYDNKHLPKGGSLSKKDIQKFNKRLRMSIARSEKPRSYKYFFCGEYGPKTCRPHYHAILLGLDMSYADHVKKCWRLCDPTVGVMIEQIGSKRAVAYVAGYASKKLGVNYNKKFKKTMRKEPEFQLQSSRFGYEYITQLAKEDERILETGLLYSHGVGKILPRAYRKYLDIKGELFANSVINYQNKIVRHVLKLYPRTPVWENAGAPASRYRFGDYYVTQEFYDNLNKLRALCDVKLQKLDEQWRQKVA